MNKRTYSAVERAKQNESGAGTADAASAPDDEDKIPDFPVDCLPPVLANITRAISAVCRVPHGMSAPMVLATASASIGRGLRAQSMPGLTTPANLYVLVCKTSGSGGSVTYGHATKPFLGTQKVLRREFEEKAKPRLDAEHADVSQQIDELKRSLKGATCDERAELLDRLATRNEELADIEKKRAGKLLFVDDVTPEKLAEMLMEQGESLAHFDSDAGDALGIILGTRYGKGEHTQDSLWLKSYTGDPVVVFRKNSKPIHLDAPCLAVLFVATPDKVQELFQTQRLTSGGLLPRFLACDPGARPMPLDEDASESAHTLPTEATQPYESAIFAAVERYRFSANDEPDVIDMTPEARRLMRADWNRFCKTANTGKDSPFEARHTENAIRIALVLHAFKHAKIELKAGYEGTYNATMHGHDHPIDAETMRDAFAIRDWFTAHQDKLREPERVAAEDSAWEKTQDLMRDRPQQSGITARDLYTGHRVCRDAATAEKLLSQWIEEGRIVAFERKPESAGRPTTAYRLAKI